MTRPLPAPSEGPSLAWRSLASKLPEIQARDSASLGAMRRQRVPVLLLSQDPGYGTWPTYRPPQACPTSKVKKAKLQNPKACIDLQTSGLSALAPPSPATKGWRQRIQQRNRGFALRRGALRFRLPLHFGPHRQQCVLTYRSSSARYRHLPAFSAAATSTPALDDACLKRTGDAPGILLSHMDTISTSRSRRLAAWLFWLTDSGLRTVALFAATS